MQHNMNDNDREQLQALKIQVEAVKVQIMEMTTKLDRMMNAVLGDEMAGSIGLKNRIDKLEHERRTMEKRIEELEDVKKNVYAYAASISFLISAISGIIFTLFRIMQM
jgi:1,2-phenylacetyl-CoA epoxidase catalytic subunit